MCIRDSGIPEEIPILETTPQNPINPYGESKLMMETIMRWADQAYGCLLYTSAISTAITTAMKKLLKK